MFNESKRPGALRGIIRPMKNVHAAIQGPAVCRVREEGCIPLDWSASLMGMKITISGDESNENSTLVGRLPAQENDISLGETQ